MSCIVDRICIAFGENLFCGNISEMDCLIWGIRMEIAGCIKFVRFSYLSYPINL